MLLPSVRDIPKWQTGRCVQDIPKFPRESHGSTIDTRFVQPEMRLLRFLRFGSMDFSAFWILCWAHAKVVWFFWTQSLYCASTFYKFVCDGYWNSWLSVLQSGSLFQAHVSLSKFAQQCGPTCPKSGVVFLSLFVLKVCSSCMDAFVQTLRVMGHRCSPFLSRNAVNCGIHCSYHFLDGVIPDATNHFFEFCKHPEVTW